MPTPAPAFDETVPSRTVLLTGCSGYVGGRLLPLLESRRLKLRCLARKPEAVKPLVKSSTEVV